MTVSIGLDFGNNYTYIGFVHGTDAEGRGQVQSLVSTRYATRGIPSLYWNNGKTELFGADAQRRFRNHPQCGVSDVKTKLTEPRLMLGDKEYTPEEIVTRMLSRFLDDAERMLRESYALEPDTLELVLTVPVDFDQTQLRILRRAAEAVKLQSGTALHIRSIVQEPVASAVRFLGYRGKPEDDVLVFDLGGGTLDVALVQFDPQGDAPYRVIDQDGDRTLGGGSWDTVMAGLLQEAFREQTGKKPTKSLRTRLAQYAVDAKEELSSAEKTSLEIEFEGNYLELQITRAAFEKATQALADQAVSVLQRITDRQKKRHIRYLILTGGGSYMPMIEQSIRQAKLLPEEAEIFCFHPERAIAEGAALLADRPQEVLANISPHGYGIVEAVPELDNEPLLRLFWRKNEPLAVSASAGSTMAELPEEQRRSSVYGIYETDVLQESSDPYEKGCYAVIGGIPYTAIYQGREVLTAILTRPKPVPAGTPVTETMALSEDLCLRFTAVDTVGRSTVEREIRLEDHR